VSGRQFAVVAVLGLVVAAVCLALAGPLDAPALYVVGIAALVTAAGARTAWFWEGRGSMLVQLWAGLTLVIVVAFVVQKVAG
jgi:hypothetical protein